MFIGWSVGFSIEDSLGKSRGAILGDRGGLVLGECRYDFGSLFVVENM